MAGGVEYYGGGIAALAALVADHEGAIRFDLLCLGLRLDWLGTELLSWVDFAAVVRFLPLSSALVGELNGSPRGVTTEMVLLQEVVNSSRRVEWYLAAQGSKRKPKKPEMVDLLRPKKKTRTTWRHRPDAMTVEEMNKRLGWS